MRVSPRFLAWTLLWAAALAAMWHGARLAGRAFDDYMEAGAPAAAGALAVLPSSADGFVFEPDPVARRRLFRQWKLDASLQEFSRLRPALENWGIAQPKVSPFEGTLLRFWPRNLAVAWSNDGVVWFAAPVGNRWQVARWLLDLSLASKCRPADLRVQRRGARWWVEVPDGRLAPEGCVAQLAVVRGVAVLGIGPRGSSPLAPVLAPRGNGLARDPEALAALEGALRPDAGPCGLVRFVRPGHQADVVSWRLIPEGDASDPSALSLDLRVPSSHARAASPEVPDAARLGALAQADDIASVVAARPDLAVLQQLCAESFPSPATRGLERAGLGWVPEPFRPIWEPVLAKLGDRVFVGVGDPLSANARGRLTLPRTVVAFPFEEPAVFVAALEQTVLRCNREQGNNMVIRKRSSPSGDSYHVAGIPASWQAGLLGIPAVGFAKGLLLAAPDTASLEKAMERATTEAAAGEPSRGVRVRARLPRLGGALRAGLLAAGPLLAGSSAEPLSPSAMRWVDESLAALRNFAEVQMDLEQEPGAWRLRARLTPARQP